MPKRPFHPVSIFLCLLTLGAHSLRAQTDSSQLPITRVTLYTSGVGYFERGGTVDGDTAQTLLFPIGQINDVLKSLVVLDSGGGAIHLVSYGALDPVSKQLQAFSVDLSDNPDQASLFNRLRGAGVTVTYGEGGVTKTLTGIIVGVQTQTIALPNGGGATTQSTLTLLGDDGLHTLSLAQITDTQINDPALRDELKAALAVVAQRRDASKRPVSLNFTGKGKRSVLVGYLTEAPLWQSSYRLVLGKTPVLQGWAMVQNTSQDDWTSIHLSLVSGRPISFLQDLYTPLYIPRPIVQTSVLGSPTPQTYNNDLEDQAASSKPATATVSTGGLNSSEQQTKSQPSNQYQFPGLVFGRPGLTPDPNGYTHIHGSDSSQAGFDVDGIPIKEPMTNSFATNMVSVGLKSAALLSHLKTSGAELGTALFSYSIDAPVSIARQKSAMVPFVAAPIQAEAVSIYNEGVQSGHPLSGARLKNTTGLHLMGGPLTVFDESAQKIGGSQAVTGYVGDALMEDTEPGQTRLISYAIDLGVDAAAESGPGRGEVTSVTISQGTLIVKRHYEQSRIYTFKNNSAGPRTVVVEHPYHGASWKLLEPAAAAERTADLYRFDIPLPAQASRKLTVRESYPDADTFALLDGDIPTFLAIIRDDALTPAVKTAVQDVIARRQHIAQIQSRIIGIDAQAASISTGQQRIRENMDRLDHNSALYQRYVTELDTQETKLNDLQAQKATLQVELARAQTELNGDVAHLTLP